MARGVPFVDLTGSPPPARGRVAKASRPGGNGGRAAAGAAAAAAGVGVAGTSPPDTGAPSACSTTRGGVGAVWGDGGGGAAGGATHLFDGGDGDGDGGGPADGGGGQPPGAAAGVPPGGGPPPLTGVAAAAARAAAVTAEGVAAAASLAACAAAAPDSCVACCGAEAVADATGPDPPPADSLATTTPGALWAAAEDRGDGEGGLDYSLPPLDERCSFFGVLWSAIAPYATGGTDGRSALFLAHPTTGDAPTQVYRFHALDVAALPALAVGDVVAVVHATVVGVSRLKQDPRDPQRARKVLRVDLGKPGPITEGTLLRWAGPGIGGARGGGGGPALEDVEAPEVFGPALRQALSAGDRAQVRRLRTWSAAFIARHAFTRPYEWRALVFDHPTYLKVGRVLRVRSEEPLRVEVWDGVGVPPPDGVDANADGVPPSARTVLAASDAWVAAAGAAWAARADAGTSPTAGGRPLWFLLRWAPGTVAVGPDGLVERVVALDVSHSTPTLLWLPDHARDLRDAAVARGGIAARRVGPWELGNAQLL